MLTELEYYYEKQPEPVRECLLAAKMIILQVDQRISHQRMYRIPFFLLGGRKLCFLWVHRGKPLIGFVQDRSTLTFAPGSKRRDQITTMQLDPQADLPVEYMTTRLQSLIALYDRSGKA